MRALKFSNQYRTIEGAEITYKYPSIDAFLKELARGDERPFYRSESGSERFTASRSYSHAKEILEGKHGKVQELKTALNSIQNKSLEFTPQVNKFSGRVNVASMLSGVENCRTRFREEETIQRMAVLSVQLNDSCLVASNNFINKAVAIANAINELEKSGVRVELHGYLYSRQDAFTEMVTIKMKRFEDTLSLGQLYGLFAPSTFRRLWFRHLEMFWHGNNVPEGYGASKDTSEVAGINIPRNSAFSSLVSSIGYVNNLINENY